MFCSEFDERLAHEGPPAVFLFDRDGLLRLADNWTRDVHGRTDRRAEGGRDGWRWLLLRDRDSGFVQIALCTSPTLLTEHPRMEVRSFESLDQARAERSRFGSPPLCAEAW